MSDFPSAASAVAILLACVALLVVASALKVTPLDRPTSSRPLVAFVGCLAAVWALAVVAIALIGIGL
jgi:hypothetical protein